MNVCINYKCYILVELSFRTDASSPLVFLDEGFKFQQDVCSWCHDVLMMSINHSNFAISDIRGIHYRCIINEINRSKAINLLQNVSLTETSVTL